MDRTAFTLVAALAASCTIHLDKNAPGRVDLNKPPPALVGHVEEPADPGENVLLVSGGGFTGIGVRGGRGSASGSSEAGVEISLHYGENERSHNKSSFTPMPPIPAERYGVNLGFVIIESGPSDFEDLEIGPIYLEAHYSHLVKSFAAGYAFDPGDRSHGPQLTAQGFGFYAKTSYRFGRGFDALFGVVVKIPNGIVWSK